MEILNDELFNLNEVVQTKINIPYTKGINIKMHKLLDKLSRAFDYKVILVSAPAGFGKSNLLASWINGGFKERVFTSWVSLDEYDNYPDSFWNYVLMALSANIPEMRKSIGSMPLGYFHDGGLNIPLISMAINEIMKLGKKVVLVMDDFHFINNPAILQGVKFFIKNMPYNMHLVISSRSIPDIGLARLRAADSVLEIVQSELSFSMEECRDFLNKTLEVKLNLEDIVKIEKDTEGWAAAIHMAAVYLKNNKSNIIKENLNNSSMIFDYLSEEVFLSLAPEIRRFLMFTSILEEFSCSLCDFILGITNSGQIIEDIDKKNLFLIRLDSKGNCYRYHNLFKNFLRSRLSREQGDFVHVLLDKAGDWYADNNQFIRAVTYYIDGKSYEKAVSLIEAMSGSLLWKGQASGLLDLNGRLPKNIVDSNPRLLLNNAWGNLAKGEINKISENLNMAEVILKDQHKEEGIESISREQLGEMAILRAGSFLGTKNLNSIIASSEAALQYFDKNDAMLQLIFIGVANAYLLKGDVKKAKEYYERIFYTSMELNIFYTLVMANRALTTIRKWSGEYSLAEAECMEVIKKLNAGVSGASYPFLGLTYACISELLLQKNDISKAMEMANKGLELGNIGEDSWVISENNIIMAQIYDALSFEKEANDALTKAEHGINYTGFLDSMLNLDSTRAQILIRSGNFKEVDDWISRIEPIIKDYPIYIYPQVVFIRARLLIAKKQYQDAQHFLDLMRSYAGEFEGILTEIILLQAIIYYELGDMGSAKDNILKALGTYKENGIVRPFLIDGTVIVKLLKVVKNEAVLNHNQALTKYLDYIINCLNLKMWASAKRMKIY